MNPHRFSPLCSPAEELAPGGTGSVAADAPKLAEEFATAADPAKMTIAQRITAAGGILAKGDAHIGTLTARIAEHEKAIAVKDAELLDLKSRLETAEAKVTKLEADAKEISDAMATIETEAKELRAKENDLEKRAQAKANERLGALGIRSTDLPKHDPAHEEKSDKASAEDRIRKLTGSARVQAAIHFKATGKLPEFMSN